MSITKFQVRIILSLITENRRLCPAVAVICVVVALRLFPVRFLKQIQFTLHKLTLKVCNLLSLLCSQSSAPISTA